MVSLEQCLHNHC